MNEDQPVKGGHRAILQRINIVIARYVQHLSPSFAIILIKSTPKRLMAMVVSGGWLKVIGTIAPRWKNIEIDFL